MAQDPLSGSQEFNGVTLEYHGGIRESSFGAYELVRIKDSKGTVLCTFTEEASLLTEQTRDKAIHRARGAVLLDRLKDLDGQTVCETGEPYSTRSETYLRNLVLQALKRSYRKNPLQGGLTVFDSIGVALVENVDPEEVLYIQRRLEGEGGIITPLSGNEIGNWYLKPTQLGLLAADEASPLPNIAIIGETVASKLETWLTIRNPSVGENLRRQLDRVAESSTLSAAEVGEVAQACGIAIQDFLDTPSLWLPQTVKNPKRDATRDRLRQLVNQNSLSDTEKDVVEGLEAYLLSWFGPMSQFIQKYRHPPQDASRTQAIRMVLYTYLFLNDLIDLLAQGNLDGNEVRGLL